MLRAFTVAVFGVVCLAACSEGQEEAAVVAAPAQPLTNQAPAGLWAVELMSADGRTIATRARVCDDGSLAPALAMSLPTVEGAPCRLNASLIVGADANTAKCTAGGAEYIATTDPQGDLGRVFTLEVSLKPASGTGAELKQTARVRRVGDCPSDWVPGDSAAPASHDITNVLTGATKTGMSVN